MPSAENRIKYWVKLSIKFTDPIPDGPNMRDEYGKVISGKINWLTDNKEL